MKIPMYQVDAFAEKVFKGNPAAVCPLKQWLPDETLQQIAAENNLSETAFFVETEEGLHIRWFTPKNEVKLCGHATLASAYIYFMLNNKERVTFDSLGGTLTVIQTDDNRLSMDFPARQATSCEIPDSLPEILGISPQKCLLAAQDMIAVFSSEKEIRSIHPHFDKLKELPIRALAVTSQSESYDFVSRFFAPKEGINEDPVTGSAHCMMAPFWSQQLEKQKLVAKQLSRRGGIVNCFVNDNRVQLSGHAVLFMRGEIEI